MTDNNDTDLQDVIDLAMSGGIAIVAFAVAAIMWQIADVIGVNPFTEESSDHPDDGGSWGINWPF